MSNMTRIQEIERWVKAGLGLSSHNARFLLAELRDREEKLKAVERTALWWHGIDEFTGGPESDEVEAACLCIYGDCAADLDHILEGGE